MWRFFICFLEATKLLFDNSACTLMKVYDLSSFKLFCFSWLVYRFDFMSEWYFHLRIWVSPTSASIWNSKTASKASLLKSVTLLLVSRLADRYVLLEDGSDWLLEVIEYYAHLWKTPSKTWEISNYLTLVPRNRPLSILKMSMLSLNNFLNKDVAAHYEIFTTQFSCSARLWKDP